MSQKLIFTAFLSIAGMLSYGQDLESILPKETVKNAGIRTITKTPVTPKDSLWEWVIVEHYSTRGLLYKRVNYPYTKKQATDSAAFYYNEKEQLVRDSGVFDPFKGSANIYRYDDKGAIKESISLQDDGDPIDTVKWTYFSTKDIVTSAQQYHYSKEYVGMPVEYKYNKYGCTEMVYRGSKTRYEYNRKGQKIKELFDGEKRVTEYRYSKEGWLLQSVYSYIEDYNDNNKVTTTTTYTYDAKGLLLNMKITNEETKPEYSVKEDNYKYSYTFY